MKVSTKPKLKTEISPFFFFFPLVFPQNIQTFIINIVFFQVELLFFDSSISGNDIFSFMITFPPNNMKLLDEFVGNMIDDFNIENMID